MKTLNNVGAQRLGDALAHSIDEDAKLSIISSYFTLFAYVELKEELSKIDEVRFLFSEPTFIKTMLDSMMPKARLIDIIKNFICFGDTST